MKSAAAFQAHTAKFGSGNLVQVAGGRETDRLEQRSGCLSQKAKPTGCRLAAGLVVAMMPVVSGRLRQRYGSHGGKRIGRRNGGAAKAVAATDSGRSAKTNPNTSSKQERGGKRAGERRLEFKQLQKFQQPRGFGAVRNLRAGLASPARMRAMTSPEKLLK